MPLKLNVGKEEEQKGPPPLLDVPPSSLRTASETSPVHFGLDAASGIRIKQPSQKLGPKLLQAAGFRLLDRRDKAYNDYDARTVTESSEPAYTAAYSRTESTDYGIYARRMALSDVSSDQGSFEERILRHSSPALPKHKGTSARPMPKRYHLPSQYPEPLMLRCILVEPAFSTLPPYPFPPLAPVSPPVKWAIMIHLHPTASVSCLAQKIFDLDMPYLRSQQVEDPTQLLLWKATPPILGSSSKRVYTYKLAELKYRQVEMPDRSRAVALPPYKAVGHFFWDVDEGSANTIHVLIQCLPPRLNSSMVHSPMST